MLFTSPDTLKTPIEFVRLWLHEATRVYGDKLVDNKDNSNFQKLKFDIVKSMFDVSWVIVVYIQKLLVCS